MALKKSIELNNTGASFPNAYHLIKRIETFKTNSGYTSNIYISIYSCEESRNTSKNPLVENLIQVYSFQYNLNSSDNIITQAYNYLKNLPEYEGCIDV